MANRVYSDRYKRAVRRISVEASWLFTYQTTLARLNKVERIGFFHVATNAILGDRLIRLVRVFDEHKDAAAFWYLHRCNPTCVEQGIKGSGTTLSELRHLSDRLKQVRDKTFIHIDKGSVFNPEMVYGKAGVKNLNRIITALWRTMETIFQVTFGEGFPSATYLGEDIETLAKAPR